MMLFSQILFIIFAMFLSLIHISYTLDRTLRWVQRQVAPTLKMLKKIDKGNGTDYMETIEQQAKLTEKHEMIIKQQTTPAKDLVES